MRFGDRLKEIFDSFGLTYSDVSQLTGLPEVELYDIINNRMSPTLEALNLLSYLVGQDLYALYTKTQSDGDIFEFIYNVDEKNTNLDFDNDYELDVMKKKISEMRENDENQVKISYAIKEYHRLYAKNQMYNYNNFEDAISYIQYYIKLQYDIDVMVDKLQRIHPTDARIILLLVESLEALSRQKEGLDILKRLTRCESLSSIMKIKCINLIAEIYESINMPKESYQFADLGIELSIQENMNALMPDLLLWKALAEVSLDMYSARSSIDLLIRYTRILRNDASLEKYIRIFKDRFGIDIMRPVRQAKSAYKL